MQSNNQYIDHFSNFGGISLGFNNSGLNRLVAMEKTSDAFKNIEYNWKNKKKDVKWSEWLLQNGHNISFVFTTYKENLERFPDLYKFHGKYIVPEESLDTKISKMCLNWNTVPSLFAEQAGLILNKMLHA